MKITKDSIIGDILALDRDCGELFLEIGMHCLGCPSATGETIAFSPFLETQTKNSFA